MTTSVIVSGATGFIAQHIIKLLLSQGYSVVGTVRSTAKGEHLESLFNSDKFTFEVVPGLELEGAFDETLQRHPEATVFLHTASPVNLLSTDVEKDLLIPAVNGTKNVLEAIEKHGSQIKHVVVTSSVVAMTEAARFLDPTYTVDEKSWNPVSWEAAKSDGFLGYMASKTFAEKAAWDFVEKRQPSFTLNTVNPVYILGPQAFDSEVKETLNFSAEILNKFLKLAPDSAIPDTEGAFIDVRDVAKAHLAAFEKGFVNERLLLSAGEFAPQNILDILNENFDSLKGKLPVGKPGAGGSTQMCKIENGKTRDVLGFSFIGLKQSVVDAAAQILKARHQA